MLTTWDQVREWIEDNNFERWIFYTKNPENRDKDKACDKLIDSNAFPSDREDKIAMTEKYLRRYGDRVWGVGFKSANYSGDGTVCTARIEPVMPANGVGAAPFSQENIGEIEDRLRRSITSELEAKWAAQKAAEERAAFEREKKEFQAEKESVIGLVVQKIAPFAAAALSGHSMRNNLRAAAGLDTDAPIEADPVQPIHAKAPEQKEELPVEEPEQSPFTDQEADQLFELMARFKAVEPDYMRLLEAVVTMAESGDTTYTMAKGVLLK